MLIGFDGKINNKGKGITLSTAQIQDLISIVNDTLTFGARHYYSFVPSIGIVFYKNNKIHDWIEISVGTNSLNTKCPLKAQYKYYEIWNEGQANAFDYDLTGFSNTGRARLRAFYEKVGIKDRYDRFTSDENFDLTPVDYSVLKRRF